MAIRSASPVMADYGWLKAALFALLGCNAVIYWASGTASEALDATAWLVLLILFQLEADFGLGARGGWTARVARGARMAATFAVMAAATGYLREKEWLDAINAGLWIAMVILLEWQLRFPAAALRQQAACTGAAAVIYSGLGVLVAAWMWQGEWFDAYDALLWLAALIVIEMNILRELARTRPRLAG